MRVDATAADDVAAGRRKNDLTAAGEERSREQNRRANLSAEHRIQIGRRHGFRVHVQRVPLGPPDVDAGRGDELDQRLDVPDARHVLQEHGLVGEQCGADDGKRGVLVAGRRDRSGKRLPSLDDELQSVHVRDVECG